VAARERERHPGCVEEELTLAELDLYDAKIDEFNLEGTRAFAAALVSNARRLGIQAGSTSASACRRSASRKASASAEGTSNTAKVCVLQPLRGNFGEQRRFGRPYASEFEHSRRFEHPLGLAQGSRGAAPGGVS
jgi:hypothetical protein